MKSGQHIPYPVLIAGAHGMLGFDLERAFTAALGSANVISTDREDLDITREASIAEVLQRYRPKLVLNASGYTNVDGAETEREAALAINATGPRLLAHQCAERGIKLVHFSTDQVFDGKADWPRREDETPNPSNYYAETKFLGERGVLANPESLVLRVQWLYGERKDRFTQLRHKEVFTPFSDQFGCPTWTKVLSERLIELLDKGGEGLYHFAHDDYASWLEIFEFVRDELGLTQLKLIPKKTSEVKLPANRPLFSVLSNQKMRTFLGYSSLGSWKTSLRDFLHSVTI